MPDRGKIIVIQFVTLDGVVEDPDGRSGTSFGGWAFRFGPEAIAGDKFALGPIMDTGALLFGRQTWEHFSRLWPNRTDPFSTAMNTLPKYVVSSGTPDLSAWTNSRRLDGELVEGVSRIAAAHDVAVIGSLSVVRALQAADAVDEYRLLIFPTFAGSGATLFDRIVPLDLVSLERRDQLLLATYTPAA